MIDARTRTRLGPSPLRRAWAQARRWALLASALYAGCATAPPPARVEGPAGAAQRAAVALQRAVSAALAQSEDASSFRLWVRYNPGRCDSPEHEIFARGRWQRVYLDVDDEALQAALESQRAQAQALALPVLGRLTTSKQRAASGASWPVAQLLELDATRDPLARMAHRGEPGVALSVSARCADR